MTLLRAVLFDMDGVLIQTEAVMARAASEALTPYGVHASPEEFLAHVGEGDDKYLSSVMEHHGTPYDPRVKRSVYDRYRALMLAQGDEQARQVQGMLGRLRKTHRIALCSGADEEKVKINLCALGIGERHFDATVYSTQVPRNKPAPDLFLLAASRLGIPPAECAVVEDTPAGLKAARAAGMYAIALSGTFAPEKLEPLADVVLSRLDQVERKLKGVEDHGKPLHSLGSL